MPPKLKYTAPGVGFLDARYLLHSLADATNDFLVASGADTFVKKTLAETGAILEGDIDHGNIQGLSTGADHSYIDQDVTVGAKPTFDRIIFTEDAARTGEGVHLFANGLPIGMATPGDTQGIKMEFDYGVTPTLSGAGKQVHGLDIKMTMDQEWNFASADRNATIRGARIQGWSQDDVGGQVVGIYSNARAEGASKEIQGIIGGIDDGSGVVSIEARTELGTSASITTPSVTGVLVYHNSRTGSSLVGDYRAIQIEQPVLPSQTGTKYGIYFGNDHNTGHPFDYGIDMNTVSFGTSDIRLSSGGTIGGAAGSMVIDSSGKVGIGTTGPDGKLHVHTATAGTVTANGSADELIIENSGHAGLSILTPNTASGRIHFGDPDDNDMGRILYDHNTDGFYFQIAALTPVTILASGNVGIGATVPENLLHLYESAAGAPGVRIETGFTNGNSNLFLENDAQEWRISTDGWTYSDALIIQNVTGSSVPMLIRTNGNVGIGETAPDTILHLLDVVPILKIESSDDNASVLLHTTSGGDAYVQYLSNRFRVQVAGVEALTILTSNSNIGIGTLGPATLLELTATEVITGNVTDDYSATLTFDPAYSADSASSFTITRHNYIDVNQVAAANAGAGTLTVTDACLFRFDAAVGTHLAVDAGTAHPDIDNTDAWIKININGTVFYVPCYTDKAV